MTPLISDPLQPVFVFAGAAFSVCLLATICAPLITLTSQILASSRKKVFYDKFAKQLATMATTLGVLCFTTMAAGILHTALEEPALFEGPLRLPLMAALGVLTFAFALQVTYSLTWNSLKKNKALHKLLGLLAGLAMFTAVFLSLGLKRAVLTSGQSISSGSSFVDVFLTVYSIPIYSVFWPLLAQALIAGMGAAGGLGLCYLLMRREADNFGRDYYNFSAAYCAKCALFPSMLQTVPAALLVWMSQSLITPFTIQNPFLALWAAGIALPLLSCILWAVIAKSNTPMRHKPGMIIALFLLVTGFAVQMLAGLRIYGLL
ncbi:hypothetical protein [Oleidesulfovibrio sp.]|uniref:hypothetical protein n=1 Tax=Oleidesulfovibrio sp. TaxID=2909707 RepID=UPI003A899767